MRNWVSEEVRERGRGGEGEEGKNVREGEKGKEGEGEEGKRVREGRRGKEVYRNKGVNE